VFSIPADRACAILLALLLILCTSSIGYLGILILGALLVPVLVRTRFVSLAKGLRSAAIAIAAAASAIGLSVVSFPLVGDVVNAALLTKASAGSGLERGMTIGLAFGYFQKFPLLGIGWGSASSHDLIVKLLSNVGVIGAISFSAAMYLVLRANWREMEPLTTSISLSRAAWFLGLAVVLLTSVFNEFPLAFGYFWVILGMAMSTGWNSDAAPARGFGPEPRTKPECLPLVFQSLGRR
jgi:O-antigen ligase